MRKIALVTGGAKGIGKAIVIELASNGYDVAINYLTSEKEAKELAEDLMGKYPVRVLTYQCDVSDENKVKEMVAYIEQKLGTIDILINNAGIAQQKVFLDISERDWERIFDVNVKGVYNCIKEVLPDMLKKKEGKIINISSIWGISGASCEVHYSASKAAVIGLTKALAKELGPSKIKVNCVAPGVIKTDMISDLSYEDIEMLKYNTPLGEIGKPEDIAKIVYFLTSDDSNFITGQIISPNGGFII